MWIKKLKVCNDHSCNYSIRQFRSVFTSLCNIKVLYFPKRWLRQTKIQRNKNKTSLYFWNRKKNLTSQHLSIFVELFFFLVGLPPLVKSCHEWLKQPPLQRLDQQLLFPTKWYFSIYALKMSQCIKSVFSSNSIQQGAKTLVPRAPAAAAATEEGENENRRS